MNNYLIYKITNPSGKFYIGVTNSFNRRMSEHLSDWKNRPEKIALHNSFTKYGFELHKKEIIVKNMPKEMAYKIEKDLIEFLNTQNSKIGLNSRIGGNGGNMIDWNSIKGKSIIRQNSLIAKEKYNKVWDKRKPIILLMKDKFTIKEICEKLNCSSSALCRYLKNNKISIKRKSKFDLNEIAKIIKPLYKEGKINKEIMQITGYSKGTICRAKNILFNKSNILT